MVTEKMNVNPLCDAFVKVDRAKKHLLEFEKRVGGFLGHSPYGITPHKGSDKRTFIFKLRISEEMPREFNAIVGDVIHNLRCALDHLAWQLVIFNDKSPDRKVAFPIVEDMNALGEYLDSCLKNASEMARQMVRELEPFKGGNQFLWKLHDLDIIDKHRNLLSIGFDQVPGSDTRVDFPSAVKCFPGFPLSLSGGGEIGSFTICAYNLSSFLKDGDDLFKIRTDMDESEVASSSLHVNWGIFFINEQSFTQAELVIPTLQKTVNCVEQILNSFDQQIFSSQ